MFKSKKEKYAYVQGIRKGNRGGKPWGRQYKNQGKNPTKKKNNVPSAGAYNAFGRVNDGRVDDRRGSVVFWDSNFDFDSRGRIKGSYTPDGKFEPD